MNYVKLFCAGKFAIALIFFMLPISQRVPAQPLLSPSEAEETLLRMELKNTIDTDAELAPQARSALDKLDQQANSPEGRQLRNRRDRGTQRIVNGLPARGRAAVGALLMGRDPKTAKAWCTGILVGCDKFLTAAHCIEDNPSADSYLVFFQETGFFEVAEVRWRKEEYNPPYFDLAMLALKTRVEGVVPIAINSSVQPLNNSIATVVGFGRTGGSKLDYGIRREGNAKTNKCPASLADKKVICLTFDAELKPRTSASNICNGDSGGGVLMGNREDKTIVEKLYGVVSGGRDKNCIKGDLSYFVDVYHYRDWIESVGEGRLSNGMCGSERFGSALEPATIVARLTALSPEVISSLQIPEGVRQFSIAMSGDDDGKGKNDFDLSVYRGAPNKGTPPVCLENGEGQFGFCKIENPEPGLWTIVASRKKGEGDVQITAVLNR